MKHPPPKFKDLMKCTCDDPSLGDCPLITPIYVWMIEVRRGINLNKLVYIVHAESEQDALIIINEDISFETLLKMPGGVRINFRVLGVPIESWGDKYILI